MPVSKANQRAVNKYVKNNYDRINVTLPKGKKEDIKTHAAACGESVNAFIGRAIGEAMERDAMPAGTSIEAGAAPERSAAAPAIPVNVMETAKAASEKTGETVPGFILRAVETQAKRDMATIRMGINPATGGRASNSE